MKHVTSETITTQKAQRSPIGMLDGAHGLATLENSAAAAWLAKRTPLEVDQAIALRASHFSVELKVVLDSRTGMDGTTRYFAKNCVVTGDGNPRALAEELRGFFTPAPARAIEGWLAELSVITARRQGDEFEEALRLRAYASRLAAYPADVARHVCLVHPWRFWPAWSEMEEVCSGAVSSRRAVIIALEREPAERERRAAEKARADLINAERAARAAARDQAQAGAVQ